MIKSIFVLINFLASFVVLAVLVWTRSQPHSTKLAPVRVKADDIRQ